MTQSRLMRESAIRTIHHFLDGSYYEGQSKNRGEIINPSTAKKIADVVYANATDAHVAVEAAAAAFPAWAEMPPATRAKILFRWRYLIEQNQDKIAYLISQEHGKSKEEALGSLSRGLDVLEFACGIPSHLKGEYSVNVGRSVDSYSMHQPLGVVVAITPFNFPVMIALWTSCIALACGNTVIVKPSEKDPSAAVYLAELAFEAGMPRGVFNVLNGAKEAVNALISHPKVEAVSFVGQSSTAKYIQETAIAYGKRVQAFGAAKNHGLVMPDANLSQAIDGIVGAAYGSAGERCMAISVVVGVGDALCDKLAQGIAERVKALKIGSPDDLASQMGPLITKEHYDKVLSYIDKGVREGAILIVDGRTAILPSTGYFVGGCLFDHVQSHMTVYQEEIFGPVLCLVRVDSYEQGVHLINNHPYANGAAIFTHDGDCARDFCHRIQVGMVGVNVPIPVPVGYHSFGGWKKSCFADHGMHGLEGVRFYTKLKTITSRWPSGVRQGIEFSLPITEK